MRCDGLGRAIENVVVSVRGPRCTQVEGTVCGKPFTQVLVVTCGHPLRSSPWDEGRGTVMPNP